MSKYLVNTDWLELVLKGSNNEPLHDKNGFRISNTYKPHDFNGFNKCNERNDAKDDSLSITLGSMHSDKVISIYDKTKEIQISNKEYIKEYWRNNGLIENNEPIDRLELRLKRPQLIGLEQKIYLLNDP